jgi:hypothetical protein
MSAYPGVFSPMYLSMIRAASGGHARQIVSDGHLPREGRRHQEQGPVGDDLPGLHLIFTVLATLFLI